MTFLMGLIGLLALVGLASIGASFFQWVIGDREPEQW